MELGAAAAAAAAGGAGMGLFSYNRGNYKMDAKNRYTRFTAGLNMAIAQTGMYRQDITDLTNLTVTRQDVYHVVAAMGLTILTAIYCPGRLGLHTPPPPAWLMGLAFVNIAGAYMFLGLTVWLCMHAAARADTAGTHLLTRFVRLPIPSQGMLDKARKYASSFEEQPLREIFRIPFTPHINRPGDSSYNDYEMDDDAKRRARSGYDVPPWYRVEREIGKQNTIDTVESMMPLAGKGEVPEHFEAYRELQNEWFPYDVYSRLSMFLAFMHLLSCWGFMQIGHSLTETRALFAGGIIILQMFMLQQIILTLDIVPMGFPVHRIGPFSFWFAYFAAAIEYKRWYTPESQQVGFVLVWGAYIIEIIYTYWLLRICAPSKDPPPVAESPGAAWWPEKWCLPTNFQHAIWLVAPPKKLGKGLGDIAGELRSAQLGCAGSPIARTGTGITEKQADVLNAMGKHGESPAWTTVRVGLIAMLGAWILMTIGFTVEVMYQGTSTPSFLSAPGLPNNARDPRYRKPKVGAHEPVEVGTGGVHGPARGVHMGSMHRRLADLQLTPEFFTKVGDQPQIAQALHDLMPHLYDLSSLPSHRQVASALPSTQRGDVIEEPHRLQVTWPVLFEPHFLACGADFPHVLALSRHGRGSFIGLPHDHHDSAGGELTSFSLEGVASHGPLAAASLDSEGLLLLTVTGATLECQGAGPSSNGRWLCVPLAGAKLPISIGGKPLPTRVALARAGADGLRAAILFPGDDSVTVFSRASRPAAPWLPSGEISTHVPTAMPAFTAGGESLLLTAGDGSVTSLNLGTGHTSMSAHPVPMMTGHDWPSTCRSSSGRLVRLARVAEAAAELLLSN